MDDDEVRRHWEANAEGWTVMSRLGYDRSRDLFNTPTFMKMLPEVAGLRGLDIGCGEGHNTRLLARRGALMTGIDIAPTFVKYARDAERAEADQAEAEEERPGIEYHEGSASALPFDDASFDFATAFMSLQDVAEQEAAVREASRVVRAGGFFQFSITHPCFQTPKWGWVRDEAGRKVALTVGDYFPEGGGRRVRVDEWTFGAAPPQVSARYPKFKTPYFERTLSGWLNMLMATGWRIEELAEPTPDDETLREHPGEYDARMIAYFLVIRVRKPAAG